MKNCLVVLLALSWIGNSFGAECQEELDKLTTAGMAVKLLLHSMNH